MREIIVAVWMLGFNLQPAWALFSYQLHEKQQQYVSSMSLTSVLIISAKNIPTDSNVIPL